ncbi:Hypothetical protein, putative [Bodo saltans]|uniref:CTLH domain-containing protein n=1 Tax=Bodo saltans TaxID=75058 RepID=A0A0S4JD66_BODSA|nr:Hypothetical protein, putative [Bodo saltans]|eukprot:CUG86890.1 Hypothetical protein, putative [Bodo saltans]
MNIPIVLQTPVTFDRKDPALHREACAVVCKWLSDHDYNSTLLIFRDEINAHARDSHSIRKSSRSIVKSVEEGNWEAAYSALKKLESLNVPEHSLLLLQLAKQHFLELVDEGDAQRAFTFFLRRIKPLEDTIGKSAFQQLTYLLTCRSVADAAAAYPVFRGWTPSSSRASLTQWVASTFDTSHTTAYTIEHRLEHSHDVSFDRLIEQALYQTSGGHYRQIRVSTADLSANVPKRRRCSSGVPRVSRVDTLQQPSIVDSVGCFNV